MLRVLRDGRFRLYLGYTALAGVTVQSMLMAFVPLFMKEQVGLSERQIILLQVGGYVAGLLSSYFWGRMADRRGSKPVLLVALAAVVALPVGWSLIPRFHAWSFPVAIGLAVFAGAVTAGLWICDQRLLYVDMVEPEKRTEYMAMYYAWIGLTGGCGPLLAGAFLDYFRELRDELWIFPVDPYTPLFAVSCLLLGSAVVLLARLSVGGAPKGG